MILFDRSRNIRNKFSWKEVPLRNSMERNTYLLYYMIMPMEGMRMDVSKVCFIRVTDISEYFAELSDNFLSFLIREEVPYIIEVLSLNPRIENKKWRTEFLWSIGNTYLRNRDFSLKKVIEKYFFFEIFFIILVWTYFQYIFSVNRVDIITKTNINFFDWLDASESMCMKYTFY